MNYQTTELEVAAFLKAKGHKVRGAKPQGWIVTFTFESEAAQDVNEYFTGAEISARELFEAHRCLRALIQQVKEHNFNTTERNRNEYTNNR
jgi:hypothetical protein